MIATHKLSAFAALALTQCASPSVVDEPEIRYEGRTADTWIEDLRGEQQGWAFDALVMIGSDDERVVPALIDALESPESITRRRAAHALGAIGVGAVPATAPLVARLADSNERVRTAVFEALPRIGPQSERVLSALVVALGDRDEVHRKYAATALGSMGEGAYGALLLALGDEEKDVREEALHALAGVGSAPSPPGRVARLLMDPDLYTATVALDALVALGPHSVTAVESTMRDVVEAGRNDTLGEDLDQIFNDEIRNRKAIREAGERYVDLVLLIAEAAATITERQDTSILTSLACALSASGQWEEAMSVVEEVGELDPKLDIMTTASSVKPGRESGSSRK